MTVTPPAQPRIRRPAHTIDVACPKCGARAGRECVTPKGEQRAPHVARQKAHPLWDAKAQEWRR